VGGDRRRVRVVTVEVRARGSLLIRDAEHRILSGVVMPYGTPAKIGRFTETFARGAFADADPTCIPLMVSHRHAELPVGRTITLKEDRVALQGEFQLSETRDADEVLALACDEVPLGLSVGFMPEVDRWSPDRRSVTRVRATLGEISVVGVGAYRGAVVTATRSITSPRLAMARLLGRAPEATKPSMSKPADQLTAAERRWLAEHGMAMADGSYPIRHRTDLSKAISSIGRAGPKGSARYNAVKAWIMRRARALGATDALPDDWRS
jgi:HK97 family phage prohead protease